MRKLLLGAAALVALGTAAPQARAQSATPVTASLLVGPLLFVSIDDDARDFAPGDPELDVGFAAGVADDGTLTHSGAPSDPGEPSTDFRRAATGGPSGPTTTAKTASVFTPGQKLTPLTHDVTLDRADGVPGLHTLDITYSVVAN